ncbi:unnamed protein product, partial [Thlaspi arvense]
GRSKRFLEIQNLRENKKEYNLKNAISLLKQMARTKFVETAEAHFRLNIDPKYNDQQLRATVNLPREQDRLLEWLFLHKHIYFHERLSYQVHSHVMSFVSVGKATQGGSRPPNGRNENYAFVYS